jgi:hypothetical protein
VVSGIGGVNFYTSERSTARTIPSVTVQAQIGSEELVPFSGVFKTPTTITYVARADTTARADFDAKFYDILEQLYRSPDLASYLTDNSNLTFYVAKVTGDSPSVISQNRTWSRAMTLDVTATSKPFSPSNLSSLSLWLKADAGLNLVGELVAGWYDQSGNSRNVTGEGGDVIYSETGINNKPALFFDGNPYLVNFSAGINYDLLNTTFIVFKPQSPSGGLISQGSNNLISAITDYYPTLNNSFNAEFLRSDVPSVEGVPCIFSYTAKDLNYNIYVNGNNTASGSYSSLAGTSQRIFIGCDYQNEENSAGYFYSGYISEIVIYNRLLTTTERQQVESYLNTKYAIY